MPPAENRPGPPLETTSREESTNPESAEEPEFACTLPPILDPCSELRGDPELAEGFHEIAGTLGKWFVMPPGQGGLNTKAIGCRVIMAMWVMRPEMIGSLSLTEISALVDARPEVLSRQASAFSKRFGVRGRAQFSDKARKAQSESAKRRRAREALQAGGNTHGTV